MKAELLFDLREVLEDGSIVAMRLWHLPTPVPPSRHFLKYSLFYGHPGIRLVLFDNERGKGDHKHIRDVESSYRFDSVERLIADFLSEVDAIRGGRT